FVPILKLSAKTGLGVERVFREIKDVYQEYNKRLGTGELNRVFQKMVEANPPPSVSGKSINLFYMTQIAVRPPRFIILTNHPKLIPEAYKRYLLREIRAAFSFSGTPIILDFRARKKKPFHA
ncbi:MAG: ribosome biogenesis GTPase Der, partial [Deltaproteobacteria bacterium]|nr:ribosome biogenesis GTPase Der [Deltaproteobacteria bacterium]